MANFEVSIVAGGAGFIGNTLIAELIAEGKRVVVFDNLSRGKLSYLSRLIDNNSVSFFQADLSNRQQCNAAFSYASSLGKLQEVWHMAANSDIPAGIADGDVDLKDTFLTTSEILRSMKEFGVKSIFFASSSAIYGDLGEQALFEEIGPLLPISNYGAMKLASEALISASYEIFLDRAILFRFPNVVGVPATHGVIYDFLHKLIANPSELQVLGDGSQQKSYLHVFDLVSAMLFIRNNTHSHNIEVINIGPVDEGVEVRWIAEQVIARINPGVKIMYGAENRGWIGDVPKFSYSTHKLQKLGWSPTMGSEQAVIRAINEIAIQFGC